MKRINFLVYVYMISRDGEFNNAGKHALETETELCGVFVICVQMQIGFSLSGSD